MKKPVILIAEDDLDTRETLRQLLQSEGFDVIGAEDSILAYGVLSSLRPDVIVADVMMPKVDGIGLIRWIKSNPEYSSIPIIAMTAYGEQHLQNAKSVGADEVLRKPSEIPDLPYLVSTLLSKKRPGDRTEAASSGD